MSLSRRLIESLVKEEINNNKVNYQGLDLEKLSELANQSFLVQVTQTESKSVKKSLQDKIEHFNAIMSDSKEKQ